MGDVDDDGRIGISDVVAIIDYLINNDETLLNLDAADVDGDGRISIADVTVVIDMLLGNV